jgi:hypothetical protein
MSCEYLFVIGTNKMDSPLAEVLAAIGKAMGKKTTVYVVNESGTFEFGKNEILEQTTVCVRRILSAHEGQPLRLLLFDAVSLEAGCNPLPGLYLWRSSFLAHHPEIEAKTIWIDQVMDFFDQETAAVWWTGLVLPEKFSVKVILDQRWKTEMGSLAHDEANNKGKTR